MLGTLRKEWRELRKGQPGHRFRNRCKRSREARASKSVLRRFLVPAIGVLLVAAGIVLCVIPGPGLPLVALGAGLLAQSSMALATLLDRLELKLRRLIKLALAWWRSASVPARNAVIVLAACLISGVGYGAYHFLFRY